jgi:hypothetical protein
MSMLRTSFTFTEYPSQCVRTQHGKAGRRSVEAQTPWSGGTFNMDSHTVSNTKLSMGLFVLGNFGRTLKQTGINTFDLPRRSGATKSATYAKVL